MKADDMFTLAEYFEVDSYNKLVDIFRALSKRDISEADSVMLKQGYLSIVDKEKKRNHIPEFVSPDGMSFVYGLYNIGEYILLTPYGVVSLFRDWRMTDGEIGVENVQWMEGDHLLLFDVVYIVRNTRQKCICHYSADSNAFVHLCEVAQGPGRFMGAGDPFGDFPKGFADHSAEQPKSIDAPFGNFSKGFVDHTVELPKGMEDPFEDFYRAFGEHLSELTKDSEENPWEDDPLI